MKDDNRSQQKTIQELVEIQANILTISPDTQIKDVLETIAEAANRVLGGDFCVVQPYKQSTDEFLVKQFTAGGNPKAKAFEWTPPRPNGTARTVLGKGFLVIEDFDEAIKETNIYPFLQAMPDRPIIGNFRDIAEVKAYFGIRLDVYNEMVGVLFVDYLEPRKFSEQEILIARLFAGQAAIAIQNTRLATNLRESLDIASALTSAFGDWDRILQTAIKNMVYLFGFTRGGIVFHEPGGGRLIASFDTRPGKDATPETFFPESSLQKMVRETKETVLIQDIEKSKLLDDKERETFLAIGAKSTVILPLVARGKVIGSLGLDDCAQIRTVSQREIYLAQLLAGLVAIAIDNARLFGIAEKDLESILLVAEKLVREALNPELELTNFLQYMIEQTLELMEFDAGWLLLREGDFVKIVATDKQHKDDVGRVFPINGCISGFSMTQKRIINITDLENMAEEYKQVYQAPRGPQEMRSELVAPLLIADEASGAFNIESERMGAFEARHEEMLSLLSGYVGLALELARLRDETKALSTIGLELSRQTEMKSIVRSVLDYALTLIAGQFGQVLLLAEDKLEVHWTTNDPPTDLGRIVDKGDSVSGLAVIEKKPVIVPDVDKPDYFVVNFIEGAVGRKGILSPQKTEKPRYKRALEAEKDRMHAEFAVPLFLDGNIIGVLNVETPKESGFTRQQQETLLAYVKTNTKQFSEALLQPAPQSGILEKLLRGALARIETDFGQILRLEGYELVIEQTSGGERIGTPVQVDKSVTGRVVRTKAPVYIPEVSEDPDYQRYLGKEMKSELVVPLTIGEDVIGVINIESPVPGFFTPDHARVLEPFAGQAVIAIERARRFEEQALAEVGGLAGDIVHSLNNPIGAISLRLEQLKRQSFFDELLSKYPYLSQFIERTVRDLNTSKKIIQELGVELKRIEPGPIALQPIIQSAFEKAELPDNIIFSSSTDEIIHVIANERLVNVLWNLFDNARKAMPNGGNLIVTTQFPSDDQWVVINVEDTGRGIELFRLELIFDPDESTTSDPHAPAHGLGLWWTKAQIESFGGTITVKSELGVGTSFTLKLRKAE